MQPRRNKRSFQLQRLPSPVPAFAARRKPCHSTSTTGTGPATRMIGRATNRFAAWRRTVLPGAKSREFARRHHRSLPSRASTNIFAPTLQRLSWYSALIRRVRTPFPCVRGFSRTPAYLLQTSCSFSYSSFCLAFDQPWYCGAFHCLASAASSCYKVWPDDKAIHPAMVAQEHGSRRGACGSLAPVPGPVRPR